MSGGDLGKFGEKRRAPELMATVHHFTEREEGTKIFQRFFGEREREGYLWGLVRDLTRVLIGLTEKRILDSFPFFSFSIICLFSA